MKNLVENWMLGSRKYMFTYAPLIRIRDLWTAFTKRPQMLKELSKYWCSSSSDTAGWLSRSSWSLLLIAIWRQKIFSNSRSLEIWVPDYFCNSSLSLLRLFDVSITFYPIDESLQPDYSACRNMVKNQNAPDLFIFVHYFGCPSPAAAARDFCQHHGAWLVEDAAHVLKPLSGIGKYGDFVLYSPHKWLAVPDGAVLVVRAKGPGELGGIEKSFFLDNPELWFEQLNTFVREKSKSIRIQNASSLFWLGKRLLQRVGIGVRISSPYSTEELSQDEVFIKPKFSDLSHRLLSINVNDFQRIISLRRQNQLLWDEWSAKDNKELGPGKRPTTDQVWPQYLIPFQLKDGSQEKLESVFESLQRRKIPVTIWPDLPPEVQNEKERTAWKLRHSLIYLPIHQSISQKMLSNLVSKTKTEKTKPIHLKLCWNAATRDDWHSWLKIIEQSNVLQSWAYGEAKVKIENWNVKHGVFYNESKPVAIFQLLERRVKGVIGVKRINRGPLFFPDVTLDVKNEVLNKISNLSSLWRLEVLVLSPELPLNGLSLWWFHTIGLRRIGHNQWSSIWIDLRDDLESIRQQLNSKWRNMLVAAEKQELDIEIGSINGSFNWMLDRYKESMQEKSFSGISTEMLSYLHDIGNDDCSVIIIRALCNNEPIAGVAVATHGVAATYLVGWNGDRGRSMKANQLMLWCAVKHLKKTGFKWFDLGGVDAESTPGVTFFKKGMGGVQYELVGDGWKV